MLDCVNNNKPANDLFHLCANIKKLQVTGTIPLLFYWIFQSLNWRKSPYQYYLQAFNIDYLWLYSPLSILAVKATECAQLCSPFFSSHHMNSSCLLLSQQKQILYPGYSLKRLWLYLLPHPMLYSLNFSDKSRPQSPPELLQRFFIEDMLHIRPLKWVEHYVWNWTSIWIHYSYLHIQ